MAMNRAFYLPKGGMFHLNSYRSMRQTTSSSSAAPPLPPPPPKKNDLSVEDVVMFATVMAFAQLLVYKRTQAEVVAARRAPAKSSRCRVDSCDDLFDDLLK
jgi:hypothetical protein